MTDDRDPARARRAPPPLRRALVDFLVGLALFAVCHQLLMLYATHQWHHSLRFVRMLLGD